MNEDHTAAAHVGDLGEEAARLVDAIRDWASTTFGPGGTFGQERIATGAPECAWCPICQTIAVLRGDRPEVTEKVNEFATSLTGAMRSILAAHSDPAPAKPPRQVQRINLGD